jgi:hypothetical protein
MDPGEEKFNGRVPAPLRRTGEKRLERSHVVCHWDENAKHEKVCKKGQVRGRGKFHRRYPKFSEMNSELRI